MTKWQPAKILYLILSIMLTFSVVPFIPFAINNVIASEGAFNVFGFLYDVIGVVIALTILTRVQKDNFKPTGALLGFVTYALAIMGQFLFFRYGQETLYASQLYRSPLAETLFSFVVMLALIIWIFNVFALVFSYVNTFGKRLGTSSKKAVKKSGSHDNVSRQYASEPSRQQEEVGSDQSYRNIDPLKYKTMTEDDNVSVSTMNGQGHNVDVMNNKTIRVQTESTNPSMSEDLTSLKSLESQIQARDVAKRVAEHERKEGQDLIVTKTTTTAKKKTATNEGKLNHYVAQLTGDLFMDTDQKTKTEKETKKTITKKEKTQEIITADELDDE